MSAKHVLAIEEFDNISEQSCFVDRCFLWRRRIRQRSCSVDLTSLENAGDRRHGDGLEKDGS